ncbi:MAG: hypothetical protein EOO81_04310 [Oxalobacteraceae bacterium]|nr:MAG: hypothetical protein EOO81_04310 [Oxalobacteraceae bacterium]
MTASTILTARNYRAFHTNELMRDGPLLDALHRHGFVYAKKPFGGEAIAALADKFLREIDEAEAEAHRGNLPDLATEAADILDVADLATNMFGATGKLVGRPPLGLLQGKLTFLQSCATLPLPAGHAAHYLRQRVEEVRGFVFQAYVNGGAALGRHAVEVARLAKNKAKGPHSGWFGKVVILPRDDEWCPAFAAKYKEEHDLSQFNIDMSLTLDHFTITRSGG